MQNLLVVIYDQLFERLMEEVDISLSSPEQKFKDFYVSKPKYRQLDFKTASEVRFWILGDGTIIRVWHDTHAYAAQEADVNYEALRSMGALRGYSIKSRRELGVDADVELSSAQKTALLRLVSKHMVKTIFVDDHSKGQHWSGSPEQLHYYLQYGLVEESSNIRMPGSYFGALEAGWIHPNGKVEVLPNYHAGDHDKDAFRKLYPEQSDDSISISGGVYAYQEYLRQGSIRFIQSSRGFNIELSVKPTVSQMKAIRNGIEEGTGDFYFSMRTGGTYGVDGSSWAEFREEMAKL